jgi:hypothetical protein
VTWIRRGPGHYSLAESGIEVLRGYDRAYGESTWTVYGVAPRLNIQTKHATLRDAQRTVAWVVEYVKRGG